MITQKISEKIIRLNNDLPSIKLLEYLIDELNADTIEDFIIIFKKKANKEEQETLGTEHVFNSFWFGKDTCFNILGMIEYMKGKIFDYIKDMQN